MLSLGDWTIYKVLVQEFPRLQGALQDPIVAVPGDSLRGKNHGENDGIYQEAKHASFINFLGLLGEQSVK